MSKKEKSQADSQIPTPKNTQPLPSQNEEGSAGDNKQEPGKVNDPKALRVILFMVLFPIAVLILALIMRKCS